MTIFMYLGSFFSWITNWCVLWSTYLSDYLPLQYLPQVKGKGILVGWSLSGAWYHIKAFGPSPFPHQRKINTENQYWRHIGPISLKYGGEKYGKPQMYANKATNLNFQIPRNRKWKKILVGCYWKLSQVFLILFVGHIISFSKVL